MTRPIPKIEADIRHAEKWAQKHRKDKKYWSAAFHDEKIPRLRAELRKAKEAEHAS